MDFNDLFGGRDSSYIRLNNVTDYLGRALRENVVIFEINNRDNEISFLSESKKLISCKYHINDSRVKLSNITVQEADDIMSDEAIDTYLSEQVSSFVNGLRDGDYAGADMDFGRVLDVYRTRHDINEKREHLNEKLKSIQESSFVTSNDCFEQVVELKENIAQFIKDNQEELKENRELLNCIRLNNSMSRAFDIDKTTLEDLVNEDFYVDNNENVELYEMVCRRELVAREITESKRNFTGMWVNNENLRTLAECMINEEDSVADHLSSLISDVPYFALASKSEINEALTKIAYLEHNGEVPKKTIREFTAVLFEMKKPAKAEIVKRLNESYGVNVNNLRYVPTFSDLAQTQSYLFESLAKSTSSKSLKELFDKVSKVMDGKAGVETLRVSDIINEVFGESIPLLFEEDAPLLEDTTSFANIGQDAAKLVTEAGYHGDMDEELGDEDDEEEEEKKEKGKAKKKTAKAKDEDDDDDDGAEKPVNEAAEEEEEGEEEAQVTDEEIAGGEVPDEEVVDDGEEDEEETTDEVDLSDEELHELTKDIEDVLGKMKTVSKKGEPEKEPDLSEYDED